LSFFPVSSRSSLPRRPGVIETWNDRPSASRCTGSTLPGMPRLLAPATLFAANQIPTALLASAAAIPDTTGIDAKLQIPCELLHPRHTAPRQPTQPDPNT